MVEEANLRFNTLLSLIRQRRLLGEPPYVLFLGAGASLSSGSPSTSTLVNTIVEQYGQSIEKDLTPDEKLSEFYRLLDNVSVNERFVMLSSQIGHGVPSFGYQCLAMLIRAGYFNLILTTNFDQYLENALRQIVLNVSEYSVLINGYHHEALMLRVFQAVSPRIKLLKLHGDLSARLFAFTPAEIFQFSQAVERVLTSIIENDVIFCGHSLRDDDVCRVIGAQGGAIWFANLNKPLATDFAFRALAARGTPNHMIYGDIGRFDEFFARMFSRLMLPDLLSPAGQQAETVLGKLRSGEDETNYEVMIEALEELRQLCAFYSLEGISQICSDRKMVLSKLSSKL